MWRGCLCVFLLTISLSAQFKDWPPIPQEPARLLASGDAASSLALLRKAAEADDPVSMFWLGRWLEEAQSIPHDYPEAMRWYRQAADRGVGIAAWSLGRLHEMGRGTALDDKEAQVWYAKAAELGFHRTALTVIKARWRPANSTGLAYEPIPESSRNPPPHPSPDFAFFNRPFPDLTSDELDLLRKHGYRGQMVWQGSEPGLFGLPARLILVAQRRVETEVRLPVPKQGTVIYVQRSDGTWDRLGDGELADRVARIHPQSPETPWYTSVTMELENGGTQGWSGWNWPRDPVRGEAR
jgi:hypothetical protein